MFLDNNNNNTTIKEIANKSSQQEFEAAKRKIDELIVMTSLAYKGSKVF